MDNKLIVILGPTSSGKSDLAVNLALQLGSGQAKKKFKINGAEIISADSRQVYKGMDIGTGKITKKEMQDIPHYLLNIVSPKSRFTVVQYRKLAIKAINKIFKKRKVPILCGGTGFYIQAVVDGITIPEVKPDWKLRKKMEKKTTEELFDKLKKLDPKRAKNIDSKNKRRIIRALEIVIKSKKPVPILKKQPLSCPILTIGMKKSFIELKKLIKKRLSKRLRQGMITEIKKLRKSGVSWKRLEDFGLEYRYLSRYLQALQSFSKKNLGGQGKLSQQEMIEKLQKEIEHFAKRQMTWFSRHYGFASDGKRDHSNKRIHWVENYKEAKKLVKIFLEKQKN